MLGLRQLFRASLRLFPVRGLEPTPPISSGHRSLLQAIESEGILKRFSTQISEQEQKSNEEQVTRHPVGKLEAKMRIMFTCKKCETRNSKTMTKLAYEKGVVIIRCDGCKNNHLIADNLGWFGEDPRHRNIEKLMKMNGETVRRLQVYGSDTFEVVSKDEMEIKTEKVEEIEAAKVPDANR